MNHSRQWYLENGFSPEAAEYFACGGRRIASVSAADDYTLVLDFDNGERRVFDCKRFFTPGSVFESIRSPTAFERVFLDECGNVAWDVDPAVDSSVHWDNRIDLCKDSCYLNSVPVVSPRYPEIGIPTLSVAEGGADYDKPGESARTPPERRTETEP